ncbi:MAG: hypothetical protein A3F18_00440 [Legionellales bacterium RIFCSPHIGHO2_12_FULL_37_14]|nr:MAG: hypothetical protein A3F18_00440 [Legionellales bacterium RIFCSPHIGHO2_12_FULL_37_14]
MSCAKERILSLDVFRGLTIALMILVNYPGNSNPYPILAHAPWHGCTLADLVFPFFLFIIGVSCVVALRTKARQNVLPKILKRTLILLLLGLFLNAFSNHFSFTAIRYFGILQRIAICYLLAAITCLYLSVRAQVWVFVLLVGSYWLLLSLYPYTLEANLVGIVDRHFFAPQHLYMRFFDPEGLLSTLPAFATTLMGNLTGYFLQSSYSKTVKSYFILIAGGLSTFLGYIWSIWLPLNKALWTSSYVLFTGGISLMLFATCYFVIEVKQYKAWARPLEIFGVNAILVYVLHVMAFKLQITTIIHNKDGSIENLRDFITHYLFGFVNEPNAAFLYAFSGVLFWLGIMSILHRKHIMIKI